MTDKLALDGRVERDQQNARTAKELAARELKGFTRVREQTDIIRGPSPSYINYLDQSDKRLRALHVISGDPFQAMVEVHAETEDKHGNKMGVRSAVDWGMSSKLCN